MFLNSNELLMVYVICELQKSKIHLGHTISENTDHVPWKKFLYLSTEGLSMAICVQDQEDWELSP